MLRPHFQLSNYCPYSTDRTPMPTAIEPLRLTINFFLIYLIFFSELNIKYLTLKILKNSTNRISNVTACFGACLGGHMRQILNNFLCILCFTRARLACTQNWLILSLGQHRSICFVRYSEHMRRHFVSLLALVKINYFLCVYWQIFIRIYDHTK